MEEPGARTGAKAAEQPPGESEEQALRVVTKARDAPVIFADALHHLTWYDNVAKLAFIQVLGDPMESGDEVQRFEGRHVVSIAMTLGAMERMSDYLQSSIAVLRKSEVLP